jgi:hypothetical protein
VLGGTAIFTLLFTFALSRTPEPIKAGVPSERFDDSWEDVLGTMKATALKKADRERIVTTEPKPVAPVRIMPDVPADVPPAAAPLREDTPVVRRRRQVERQGVERDVCTQHRLRKVWTHNHKRWRCR